MYSRFSTFLHTRWAMRTKICFKIALIETSKLFRMFKVSSQSTKTKNFRLSKSIAPSTVRASATKAPFAHIRLIFKWISRCNCSCSWLTIMSRIFISSSSMLLTRLITFQVSLTSRSSMHFAHSTFNIRTYNFLVASYPIVCRAWT